MILPLRVLGRPEAMWITSGAAKAPIMWRTCSLSAPCSWSLSAVGVVGAEQDVGVDPLALDRVREAHHRRLRHRLVGHERALDLGGPQPVARDVEHVVDAAGDPVVAVLVAPHAVAGEVVAGVLREVGLLEAVVVAPHRPRLARPRRREAQRAAHAVALEHLAVGGVQHHRLDAEEGQRGRAGLGRA